MVERRFKHLKWRERRPPILPFNSYVLLQKLEPKGETQAAPPLPAPATEPAPKQARSTAQATTATEQSEAAAV